MYVCNCNGVRCHQVDEAIAQGAGKPRQVLAHYGHEPQCGRCLPEIAERLIAQRHTCEREAASIAAE
jgi:bacterioferritin-associated ferredoxin